VERLEVPDDDAPVGDWLQYLMHDGTYRWAEPHAQGRRVLDLGCGAGYGTASLAPVAERVVGVDVSDEAIAIAQREFGGSGAEYQRVDDPSRVQLPFADASFDTVLSFQVIEHLDRPEAYLDEAARLLTPGGSLLLATPDRAARLFAWQKPWNRFHETEYDGAGLAAVLHRSFATVELLGMTVAPEYLGFETGRYRQARLSALPFTFPGAPEAYRKAGLSAMTEAVAQLTRRRAPTDGGDGPRRPTVDAIEIGPDVTPRLFLLAIAQRAV
jgi:SAM-dependent methyltransferase